MLRLDFDNRFIDELPGDPEPRNFIRQVRGAAWSAVMPTPVCAPRVLAWSEDMARRLGFDDGDMQDPAWAGVFSGNRLVPGMQPFAVNYGGHQFGHWAGQLGDGRAISLGEAVTAGGERWELQLKGAGPTPYSRGADGRAVLRSSIREFLCSEAMHHLGVPTTRALCLMGTGEQVERDMFYDGHPQMEPGAVVCRVAPSFIRFGTFELPASRGDTGLLRKLVDFTIDRDYPHLAGLPAGEVRDAAWFGEVCERTAGLMAEWMRVGFVHGVMNTDNLSILGLTIDYGPYGWIDNYDPAWTPNTTDAQHGRYRFGQQPQVAYWNLGRLAGALAPLFADPAPLQEGLQRYVVAHTSAEREVIAGKLGLADCRDGDVDLMQDLRGLMAQAEVDMTLFFRGLMDVDSALPRLASVEEAFYDPAKREQHAPEFVAWLGRLVARWADDPLPHAERRERMRLANPRYVLRNYLAQQAIDRAHDGDLGGVHELLEVMRAPYDDQPRREAFARRRPDWARRKAGCSMLSCSS
ncbi:protein adenylyltransferase SelO [Lysobacter sp. A3-1-A15]|uniref:protein adenylyltransferase SelO n=1 Tax=Novilysobacter viscosus TaxID=3098602 RepID=UPI002ED9475B